LATSQGCLQQQVYKTQQGHQQATRQHNVLHSLVDKRSNSLDLHNKHPFNNWKFTLHKDINLTKINHIKNKPAPTPASEQLLLSIDNVTSSVRVDGTTTS